MDRSGSLLEETWSALDNDADGVLNYEEVRGSFLRLPLLPVLAVLFVTVVCTMRTASSIGSVQLRA